MTTHEADGSTCACHPGHRCLPCKRRKSMLTRLIVTAWRDDPDTAGARYQRDHLTWEQQVDRRDAAWTARDAYSIYVDRDQYAHTWWELKWPEYWQRQDLPYDRLPRPTVDDLTGWAASVGRDLVIGGKTSDAFPEGAPQQVCTKPLNECEGRAFVFARFLSPALHPSCLSRTLVHWHSRRDEQRTAPHVEEDLDLFTAMGVTA